MCTLLDVIGVESRKSGTTSINKFDIGFRLLGDSTNGRLANDRVAKTFRVFRTWSELNSHQRSCFEVVSAYYDSTIEVTHIIVCTRKFKLITLHSVVFSIVSGIRFVGTG